jgi:hypothetical protein
MQPGPNITTFGEVTDAAGNNRLVLRFIERPLPKPEPGRKAYDFHSLVWEVRTGDAWAERVVITREDFERGARRRWVSALHNLDPAAGTAIIKVGEEQTPDARGVVHVEYSWREWDLAGNRQVRVFRVCASPHEPFEDKGRDG